MVFNRSRGARSLSRRSSIGRMWWRVRAPSSSNPRVKIPNGPEQTTNYKSGQTKRAELAGTLPGGQFRHPKMDTNLSLPIPLINNCWVQSVKPHPQQNTLSLPLVAGHGANIYELPVLIAPARSYVTTMTPSGVTLLSVTLNAAGIVPSVNNRFPLPNVIG
jgi:hypothetical protein